MPSTFDPLAFVAWSSGVSVLPFAALSWLLDPPGVPVIGLLAGIALLHEPVSPLQWAGALLVLAALASVVFGERAAALLTKSPPAGVDPAQ
jgi:drug/metabolite transporter (DMT)-like permease